MAYRFNQGSSYAVIHILHSILNTWNSQVQINYV